MYKIIDNQNILHVPSKTTIPVWEDNRSYQEYLKWVNAGNTPIPADVVASAIPASVTMRQARLALLQAGYYSSVQTAINAIEDPVLRQASQIEWEYAATVDRGSSFTQGMANALGLTEEAMNNLFILAASL